MLNAITTGPQTLTAPGAFTGVLDTSALAGDFTIELAITALTPATSARIAIEDATSFTTGADNLPVAIFQIEGPVAHDGPVQQSLRRYQVPDTRTGATSTKLRATLLSITAAVGINPSITINALLGT